MGSNYRVKYNVDIVMCMDATGSMGGLLNMVKENALNFYSDLTNAMAKKDKFIDELRVRVIAFRDYIADREKAMLTSDFYSLPDESADFRTLVSSVVAEGGGDDPEDGLEALAYAIHSDWTKGGSKRRHIIVVWSDEETHPLGYGNGIANYPKDMARDFDELTEWWDSMDYNDKRLIIFAPDKAFWNVISDTWDNVIHYPSEAGKGLKGLEYEQVMDAIANSI